MLINAIVGNLVGDYLLQNDWMALNKKSKSFHCAVHCAIWTACVCLFSNWHSPLVIALLFVDNVWHIVTLWAIARWLV